MSLELLNKRLQYHGGNQQKRFINDKLRSLKKALLYSYQAATMILSDGKEFRCLINPDKNKPAYDNKILSVPFKDICLNDSRIGKTSQGEIDINISPGDTFIWKQTDTHWLIYLQYLEQDAYYRFQIRRCDQQIKINDNFYWVYIRGPVETSIQWNQKAGKEWNDLNYSLVMYITANDETKSFFKRFETIKILDPRFNEEKTWQVVGVDPYYGDGIIQIFLDEYFENSIQDQIDAVQQEKQKQLIDETVPYIDGPTEVTQYSKAYYTIKNKTGGYWYISWQEHQASLNSQLQTIPLNISIGETGVFTLIYRVENEDDVTLDVMIKPL